jgi:hypothetical protein
MLYYFTLGLWMTIDVKFSNNVDRKLGKTYGGRYGAIGPDPYHNQPYWATGNGQAIWYRNNGWRIGSTNDFSQVADNCSIKTKFSKEYPYDDHSWLYLRDGEPDSDDSDGESGGWIDLQPNDMLLTCPNGECPEGSPRQYQQ